MILAAAISVTGCVAAPPQELKKDPFVEKWIGSSKEKLIKEMGQPTRQSTLGQESTLVWEKNSRCYIVFNTGKDGTVKTGYRRRCGEAE